MSDAILGEIRPYAGATPPPGWASCDGQLLPVGEHNVLFDLLGIRFGGDGVTTFGLPDLRGRVPLHGGAGPGLSARVIGEAGGIESEVISTDHLPKHSHPVYASGNLATSTYRREITMPGIPAPAPVQGEPVGPALDALLYALPGTSAIVPTAFQKDGGHPNWVGHNDPHENRMPMLAIRYMIAVQGIIPARPAGEG